MADGFVLARNEDGDVIAAQVVARFSSDGKVPIFELGQVAWPVEIPGYLAEAISGLLDRLEEVTQGA